MSRRGLVVLAGGAAGAGLAGALAACGAPRPAATPPTPAPTALAPATLRLAANVAQPEMEVIRASLDEFRPRFPRITVEFENYAGGDPPYPTKMTSLIASGTAPDVWDKYDESYAIRPNVVLELEPFIARDRPFRLDAYFEGSVEFSRTDDRFRRQGKVKMLTWGTFATALFFNQSLFEREGLKPPDASWDWARLVEAATRLTSRGPDGKASRVGLDWFLTSPTGWTPIIYSFGGSFANGELTRYTLSAPEVVEGFEYLRDLRWKHRVMVVPNVDDPRQFNFRAGNVAMFVNHASVIPGLRNPPVDFTWDVAVIPRGKAGRFTRVFYNGFEGYARTRYPDQTWELLKQVTGESAQKLRAERLGYMPSLKAVASSPAFLGVKPPENMRAFVESVAFGRDWPIYVGYLDAYRAMQEELKPVWDGDSGDVRAALQRIVDRNTPLLAAAAEAARR